MYCTNCNAKIDAYIEICRACGIRLDIEVLKDQRDTENLVARLKNGDSEAFAELYNKNYAKVLFAIRSFIKDEDAAMDLLQDTFIKAYQNIGQLKDDDHFTPWVRQIAANTAKNWLVKKKPDLFSYVENEGEEFDDSFEDRLEDECVFDMPEEKLDRDETSRLIREILDDLPDNQRAVVTLFFYQDMKVKDIAEFLSMPEGTVKSNLKYAKEKIEKKVLKLEKEGTKLYGLVPLAFLLWLWRNMDAHANEITPDAQILSNVQEAVGASGASGGASAGSGIASSGTAEGGAVAASGAAEGAAAGTAAAGISAKTIAIIAAVVIGAGGGAVALSQLGGGTLSVEAQWQEQYDLGVQYYEDGQYEEAVDAFTEAITLIEEEPDAYVGRGDSYVELEEDEEALEDYLTAISYGADGASVYLSAAGICIDEQDYESAVSILKEAPEDDEVSSLLASAAYNLGLRYYEDGRYEDAVDAFTEVIELIADDLNAYLGRGDSYFELEEYEKAFEDYQAAISYGAEDTDVYLNAAKACMELGDYESAVDLLEDAPDPEDEAVVELLASAENELAASEYLALALEYEAAGELNAAIHTLLLGRFYWTADNEIYAAFQRIFVPIAKIEGYDSSGDFYYGYTYEWDDQKRIIYRGRIDESGQISETASFSYDEDSNTMEVLNEGEQTSSYVYTGSLGQMSVSYFGIGYVNEYSNNTSVFAHPFLGHTNETTFQKEDLFDTSGTAYSDMLFDYGTIVYNEDGLITRMNFYDEDGNSTGYVTFEYEGYEEYEEVQEPSGDGFISIYLTSGEEVVIYIGDEYSGAESNTTKAIGYVDGITYDAWTNTLTLDNFKDVNATIGVEKLGDDFKMEIIGECRLMYIDVQDGCLELCGDGELILNEVQNQGTLTVSSSSEHTGLIIGNDLTLTLYEESAWFGGVGSTGLLITVPSGAEPLRIDGVLSSQLSDVTASVLGYGTRYDYAYDYDTGLGTYEVYSLDVFNSYLTESGSFDIADGIEDPRGNGISYVFSSEDDVIRITPSNS